MLALKSKPKAVLLVLAACTLALSATAQQQKRVSPHETVSTVIDGGGVIVVYGRPFSKDPKSGEVRKIWGGVVPYGKVWRTGADEATLFVTEKALTVGDKNVPAGAYALFTLPQEDGSLTLILNKGVGQFGSYAYDEKQDVARIDLKKETLETPVDQFTVTLDRNKEGGGALKLSWEKAQYSVALAGQK